MRTLRPGVHERKHYFVRRYSLGQSKPIVLRIIVHIIQACTHNKNPLETLLLDLSLGSSNRSTCVGVDKATAELAVLLRGSLGGADSQARAGDLGAACGRAVGIVDAASGDELGGVSCSDALGAGVVGGESESGDGN